MTKDELQKIPFRMVAHLNMEHEHCCSYKAVHPFLPSLNLGMCVHQPYKNGEPKGKSYTHYKLNGEVYKSIDKFIKAINEVENKNKDI